jgi:pimeloyl-ACP methyl ester carboxylesterase
MVEDCLKLFEIHQIEKAILIGQSMGGNLAQELTYYHPEIVEKLVLIDCSKNTQKLSLLEKISIKMSPIMFRCYPWKTLVSESVKLCGNTEYTRDYARRCLEKTGKKRTIEILMSTLTCLHEDDSFRFKQPVLLICGVDEKTTNVKEIMPQWVNEDSSYKLCMIENAGHNSNQDNPKDVNKNILAFLNDELENG